MRYISRKTIFNINHFIFFSYFIVIIFSFMLPLTVGRRGFYPFDQSIVFDGAYRVLCGQVPFLDFFMPFLPMAIWIQALSFHILGTNYWAYVIPPSIMNTIATICTIYTIRLLFQNNYLPSIIGGLLTSIYVYPIFGTTYPEQTSFFFCIVGIAVIFAAMIHHGNSKRIISILLFFVGCIASLSFLCKQNAGILTVLISIALIVILSWPKVCCIAQAVSMFMLGAISIMLLFVLWLSIYSDIDNFIMYAINIAGDQGIVRLTGKGFVHFVLDIVKGKGNDVVSIISICWMLFLATVIIFLKSNNNKKILNHKMAVIAAIICFISILFHNSFSLVSFNNGINEKPLLGVISGIVVGLVTYLRTGLNGKINDLKPLNTLFIAIVNIVGAVFCIFINNYNILTILSG